MTTRAWYLLTAIFFSAFSFAQDNVGGFTLAKTIPMPGVQGKFDHSTIDTKGKRRFVAATGNHTVEVLDLESGNWINRIPGFQKAQGISFAPDVNVLLVTDGIAGVAKMFAGDTLQPLQTVKLSADADYVTYDPATKRFLVAHGGDDAGHDYGEIAFIDVQTGKIGSSVRTAGHPEAMKLDSSGARLFVNVPDANHVAVVDPAAPKVGATWAIPDAKKNVPMAFNEAEHRLYIATRNPAKFIAYNSDNGKVVASLPTVGGADDMFYDEKRRQVYVSGGDGYISVVKEVDADHYRDLGKLPTGPGAKTSLFVPEFNAIYLAVPAQGAAPAVLKIFKASN